MGLPVFYVTDESLDRRRASAIIRGSEARHLARSLRARTGDSVTVSDAKGTFYGARIESSGPDCVTLRLLDYRFVPPERPQVVQFQAVAANSSMDEAVARAAESGVARFVPFVSRRSPLEAVRKCGSRIGRWKKIALESSKTARRAYPLEVRETAGGFDEDLLATVGDCLVLWEGERRRPIENALNDDPPRSIGLIVGPEGGFEASEVDVFRSMGARPASLGGLNMRAQSAGSYAAVIVRFRYGLLIPGERLDDG